MQTVSAADAAAYILQRMGTMTTMKLQKLLYYCQAWSLVWDEEPLFYERIEAWASGPVVREVFEEHRNMFNISQTSGDPSKLSAKQIETIEGVLSFYGDKPSQWLSDLTHMEDPWKNARDGLAPGVRSNRVISHAAMMEYYTSL
jgi:uncharacterized phage-associated protein